MINKVIILGNVGTDPEIRVMDGGVKVARIRVATTEKWTDKNNQRQEATEWHTVVLWRGLADVVDKYVHKGSQLYIEGKIRYREFEYQGEKKYFTEIEAEVLKLCGRAQDTN